MNGKDGKVDMEKLAKELVKKLPPVVVQLLDGAGNVKKEIRAPLGQAVQLPPVVLQIRDLSDNVNSQAKAIGEPLRIKLVPIKK